MAINMVKKVWISDIGIALTLLSIFLIAFKYGLFQQWLCILTLVINCWLVVYTWLHHTDSDVPHFSNTDFSFMRGAFLSIDRPYGKT